MCKSLNGPEVALEAFGEDVRQILRIVGQQGQGFFGGEAKVLDEGEQKQFEE